MARARYIFLTDEGYTYQPKSEAIEPDIENLQVLGFGAGETPEAAFHDFLETYSWIGETTFRTTYCYRLGEDYCRDVREFMLKS